MNANDNSPANLIPLNVCKPLTIFERFMGSVNALLTFERTHSGKKCLTRVQNALYAMENPSAASIHVSFISFKHTRSSAVKIVWARKR